MGFINLFLQLLDQPSYLYADDDSLLSTPVYVSLPASSSSSSSSSVVIKNKLPIVTFGGFQGETCAICLNDMEGSHEMRELPNCCHAFHVHCLDSWMDQHHFTCPTCRSNFVPLQQQENYSM